MTSEPVDPGAVSPKGIVLVVDDNEANRVLTRETLEDEGYRVLLARGGVEGIDAFARERPDCVLLDVRMPETDGFEVCRRIRALPNGRETPIVFLTALRDVDTFDRALQVGADDFLTKPVRPAELVVRVDTALKLRRMRAELREHYDLLKRQRDDLLRVQLQKERLMSFVVHDLKNPVNSMDLNAQLVLRDPALSTRSRDAAQQIRQDARQLVRLIMNLLDVSKGDEGKLVAKRTEIDVAHFLAGAVDELRLAAETRRIRVETQTELANARLDEDLFRRVLANLLENSLRHSPRDSVIVVSARATGAETEFRVADAGTGVPDALKAHIFDAFVQMEGGDRPESRSGRGLGLAFCRLAVEAHGGRIWIEDAEPGAVFCVRIPEGD
ncbi:MAG TPA: response regulator [Polyangiaceae bacterium]|nr:response regulator [Polyangiaceae bacterium]